jgi:hypothetical protein
MNRRIITPHRDFFYPTSDDWYPNYPRDTVRVRVHDQTTPGAETVFIRISVWGADDVGMERDHYVPVSEKEGKLREVVKLADNLPNPLTKSWLRDQGFVPA